VLTEAACLALLTRRRWPYPTLVICLGVGVVYLALGYPHGPALFPLVVALYTVAVGEPRRSVTAAAGVAATAALIVMGGLSGAHSWINTATVSAPGWTAAAVFLGWAVGNRRAFVAEIQDRAERAERTREEQARHAVDTERLRIARELHDVVAHTMSMISMQAGVAAHVIDTHPDKAADSLQIIHTASKQGLRELRAILGVLRQVDTADTSAPTPGLAHLGALIESTRAAHHRLPRRRPWIAARRDRYRRLPDRAGSPDEHPAPRRPDHRNRDHRATKRAAAGASR